jgi:hypothetical protein
MDVTVEADEITYQDGKAARSIIRVTCPKCTHKYTVGINAAAILGAKGGAKSRRKITPEQQADMQRARKAKGEL